MAQVHSTPVRVDSEGYTVTIIVGAGGAGIYYGSSSDPATLASSGTFAAAGSTFLLTGPAWVVSAVAGQSADLQIITASASAQPAGSAVAPQSVIGGRKVISSSRAELNAANALAIPAENGLVRHDIRVAATDVRGVFAATEPAQGSNAIANPYKIRTALVVGGVVFPCTFQGAQTATIYPGGVATTDPVGVTVAVGDTVFWRTFVFQEFGAPTTLAAAASSNAATLSLTAWPAAMTFPAVLQVDNEAVTVLSVTGSGPYTATLAANTTAAHSSGASIGQYTPNNTYVYEDRTEGLAASTVDMSQIGTIGAPGKSGTTLTATANAGDTKITLAVNRYNPQFVIDAGGTPETVTVSNVVVNGAAWDYYLTAPLAAGHASGQTVTPVYGNGAAYGPIATVADRVKSGTTPKKTVVTVGDSIPQGTGYQLRGQLSYLGLALEAAGVPHVSLAKSSESAATWAVATNSWMRRRLLTVGDWLLMELAVNDLGNTAATIEGNVTAILTAARDRGLKTAVETVGPRTTSTDFWATTGNQTLFSSSQNTTRIAYNAWVRAGCGGLADLIVESADALESARDSGFWKAGGTAAGSYTFDGLHPSIIGHTTRAAVITSTLVPVL